MDEGTASSTRGSFVYRSNLQRTGDKTTNITRALVCLQCGYTELYLDPQTLKERLGR